MHIGKKSAAVGWLEAGIESRRFKAGSKIDGGHQKAGGKPAEEVSRGSGSVQGQG